jgi:hypothetical protein
MERELTWQDQVLDVAEEMIKEAENAMGSEAAVLAATMRGFARELKAIVKTDKVISFATGLGIIKTNPVIEQAKKKAKDDADFAAAELRRQEIGGEAMTQLQGGPDDGTFVASPPGNVPVGAKTNFGTHVYQVTEQRGLVYVGEMEK